MVEQETGICAVFCTPLLERKIQKTWKKAKNWSKKCFTWNIFTPTIEKRWLDESPTHPLYNYHEALHNDLLHNLRQRNSAIHRLLIKQSMIQRRRYNESLPHHSSTTEYRFVMLSHRRNIFQNIKTDRRSLAVAQDDRTGLTASGPFPAQKCALVASHPTTYLPRRIQKDTKHSLPFYGFGISATFAKIPTWGG